MRDINFIQKYLKKYIEWRAKGGLGHSLCIPFLEPESTKSDILNGEWAVVICDKETHIEIKVTETFAIDKDVINNTKQEVKHVK